jgi:ribosomal-protein-alanine N-acetyltransferase
MSLKIRSLLEADITAILKIVEQYPNNTWSQSVFKDCLQAGYQGYVLENQNQVIGFIIGLIQDHECQLMNIGIEQSYWRRGYGAMLLDHLIELKDQNSISRILLEVRHSNIAAIKLYESRGFVQLGIRKGYYPGDQSREDAEVYALEL